MNQLPEFHTMGSMYKVKYRISIKFLTWYKNRMINLLFINSGESIT